MKDEQLIAQYLKTPEGKRRLKRALQMSFATAADRFPEDSVGERLCRLCADLPEKPRP